MNELDFTPRKPEDVEKEIAELRVELERQDRLAQTSESDDIRLRAFGDTVRIRHKIAELKLSLRRD